MENARARAHRADACVRLVLDRGMCSTFRLCCVLCIYNTSVDVWKTSPCRENTHTKPDHIVIDSKGKLSAEWIALDVDLWQAATEVLHVLRHCPLSEKRRAQVCVVPTDSDVGRT